VKQNHRFSNGCGVLPRWLVFISKLRQLVVNPAILNLELRQQHFSLFLFPSSFSVEEISRKQ
jgi:hypothetical protein